MGTQKERASMSGTPSEQTIKKDSMFEAIHEIENRLAARSTITVNTAAKASLYVKLCKQRDTIKRQGRQIADLKAGKKERKARRLEQREEIEKLRETLKVVKGKLKAKIYKEDEWSRLDRKEALEEVETLRDSLKRERDRRVIAETFGGGKVCLPTVEQFGEFVREITKGKEARPMSGGNACMDSLNVAVSTYVLVLGCVETVRNEAGA